MTESNCDAKEVRSKSKKTEVSSKMERERSIKVLAHFNKKQLEYVQKTYFDYEVITGNDHHNHPIAALERKIVERKIISKLRSVESDGWIHDIGGSAVRNRNRMKVHSTCPVLTPEDEVRDLSFIGMPNYCKHKIQDCNCLPIDEISGYMSIHSLYYLTPKDVHHLLWRGRARVMMAAVHMFESTAGSFCNGEIVYHLDSNMNIVCNAAGTLSAYKHDSMQWLRDEFFNFDGKSICWKMEKYGDTWIVTFVRTTLQRNYTISHQTISQFIDRPSGQEIPLSGFVNGKLTSLKAIGIGQFIIWNKASGINVVVPVTLINYGRRCIMGQVRNEDSFQDLVQKLKVFVSKNNLEYKGSPLSVEVILYAAKTAFLADIGVENGVYSELIGNLKTFAQHDKNRHFKKPSLMPTIVGTIGTAILAKHVVNTKIGLGILAGGLVYQLFMYSRQQAKSKEPQYRNVVQEQYEQHRVSAVTVNDNDVDELPTTTTERPLLPIRQDCGIRVGEIDKPTDLVKKGLFKFGPGLEGHIPIVYANNQKNMETAVTNRCLTPNTFPIDGKFDQLDYNQYLDFSLLLTIPEVSFRNWNRDFPKGRRDQHIKAKKILEEEPISLNDLTRESFVKVEKYNKSNVLEVEYGDPRLIQGVGHKANVVLGPSMKRFAKFLKKNWGCEAFKSEYMNWKDINRSIYYFSDNSETAGAWWDGIHQLSDPGIHMIVCGDDMLALVIPRTGKIFYVENDFSRFDKTIQAPALDFEQEIYEATNYFDKDALFVISNQRSSRGRSRLQVHYNSPDGRNSGDPNTSCGNSMLNGMISMEILTEVLFGSSVPEDCLVRIEQEYLEYGLIAKSKISSDPSQVEFCSKLFWPTSDGTVLGPKLGRVLPKMCYSIKQLNNQEILSTMKGWLIDGYFVPGFADIILTYFPSVATDTVSLYHESIYSAHCAKYHQATQSTHLFFEQRYDINAKTFIELVKKAVANKPAFIQLGVLEDIYSKDN
jgi:hypothetical protein